ncbi:regulator of (H+)-ATPase in vacuolar membrane, variant 2 [Purpureocillium takamizusanense]|uniref:Regulator of (H+)-ATPase in vacuolar membrane, variant 2 n=1 Tax=Purpureocillium takamizusanense TaxID=2060973 RepID=A0A9Q8QJI6_9HYPO|nr:regulator of (H+)-ATPase in vacuolar membrane, variant 2 [Purpureocillium takamizusanense]UNI19732.1 regulator of (H+)-ATPase in vacuolar membrane, variant 2 [Purpureocillium takamizusanense]
MSTCPISGLQDSMAAVLPGRPQSSLQGLATGFCRDRHLNAYISGSAFTILDGSQAIVQTIYDNDDKRELEAIALDEISGNIAVSTAKQVRIYKLLKLARDDSLQWVQEASFDITHAVPGSACSLSWGNSEELLVGTRALSLYATRSQPSCCWMKALPSPVSSAAISFDSAYIASIGRYDRLPKIWRRLTYGADEVRFDMSYLRHPDVVTSVRWRRPFHPDQVVENILYTLCRDLHIRIWTPIDSSDGRYWQLWGHVSLMETSSRLFAAPTPRLVCIIDGRDFTAAVECAVKDRMADDQSTDDVALDHLVAVANRSPEICLVISPQGIMSAWALENVGDARGSKGRIFSIAQVQSRQFESLGGFLNPQQDTPHLQTETYCDKSDGRLRIMVHAFDGRIGVLTSNVADLLDPTTNDRRLALEAVWSGHSSPIKKIVRNFSGRAIVSRTDNSECIVWQHGFSSMRSTSAIELSRRSVIPETRRIHRISLLRKGRFIILLCDNEISLWDCRAETATLLSSCSFHLDGNPLCLIILPRPDARQITTAHVATVSSDRHGMVWEVRLPRFIDGPLTTEGAAIEEFCRFEMAAPEDLKYVLPVDPAGSSPMASGFLDVFARDVAISYTRSGRVDFWTARIDPARHCVEWLSTCYTETGIPDPALASGSMLKKAALVNSARSQITIWDIGGSRLEFEKGYATDDDIRDLDWTSTPDSQSILAVGFQHRVVLLSQMRFDYLNKGPAWAPIREISIRSLSPHPIGDSTWLGDGHLVVGAGNQLFAYDRRAGSNESLLPDVRLTHHRKDGTWDLFEAVQRFNGPIPVFHPQFLSQCILSGKSIQVRRILEAMHKTLKYLVPGEPVDDYLGLDLKGFYTTPTDDTQPGERPGVAFLNGHKGEEMEEDEAGFSEKTAVAINEKLLSIGIPQLSGHEQMQLADMVECVALVEKHRRSMDENAARFMVFFRQNALRRTRSTDMYLSWREFNWAYHSGSQDLLLDFVSRQAHGQMLWNNARESGIFMWLSDINTVKDQFEIIARNEYNKGDTKNPVDCSLFYLALRKKAVLQGLWRMASWNKEQAATQRLLANNFDEPKWRTAALKNAYALLSKRRFAYAAAFFLLADRLEDAVEVCLRQLRDMHLAVAIARVHGGDSGPVLRKILRDEMLPLAAQQGNRWLASWAFWMLGRKDMAVRALIVSFMGVVRTDGVTCLVYANFESSDTRLHALGDSVFA